MAYTSSLNAKAWDNKHIKFNLPKHREDGSYLWLLPIDYQPVKDLYKWSYIIPFREKEVQCRI